MMKKNNIKNDFIDMGHYSQIFIVENIF